MAFVFFIVKVKPVNTDNNIDDNNIIIFTNTTNINNNEKVFCHQRKSD